MFFVPFNISQARCWALAGVDLSDDKKKNAAQGCVFVEPADRKAQAFLREYFALKRSTRPSLSRMRLLPV